MDWKILIVSVLFAISTCAVVPQNLKPNFSNLIAPPKLIVYQGSAHAVFDMGGMKYLYKVIGEPNAYPQCNVIQKKGKEIMVVSQSPQGYAFFVEGSPIAFKTDHNSNWSDVIRRTHNEK